MASMLRGMLNDAGDENDAVGPEYISPIIFSFVYQISRRNANERTHNDGVKYRAGM